MDADTEFTEYMVARWDALYRSAVLLGYHAADAEDLVQNALTKCYIAWPKVRRADNRDAYVYRVMMNAHADSRRRNWWGETPHDTLPEPLSHRDETNDVDASDAVQHALDHLTPAKRAVVVLRFYAHLSERQIAEALNIPPGTVKSRLSHALADLSKSEHLADLPEETDR